MEFGYEMKYRAKPYSI